MMPTLSYQSFTDAMERLELDERGLCALLGYSNTSWYRWRYAQKVPRVVGLACNYLTICSDPDVLAEVAKSEGMQL